MITETQNAVDVHLDDVIIRQLTWKPSTCQQIALAIVAFFTAHPFNSHFTDEVDLSFVSKSDTSCIGTAWRNLCRNDILEHGTNFRRSKKEASKGSTIFDYRLKSVARAKTFLQRNNVHIKDEQPRLL